MAAPLAAVMSVQSSRQNRCWVGCKTAASKFGGGFANRCRNLASMIPRKVWPIYAVYLAMQVLDTTAGPLFLSFLRTLVICDSHLTPAAAANPNPNPSDNWTGSMFCDDVNTVIQKAQERKGKLDCLMSCAHAVSIPAFGLLCDRRGRKYMLILAIWGLILFYVILLLLSLWVAPSAQDKLMYLGSSALSRDPVWGTRMGSQLDFEKELSSSAASAGHSTDDQQISPARPGGQREERTSVHTDIVAEVEDPLAAKKRSAEQASGGGTSSSGAAGAAGARSGAASPPSVPGSTSFASSSFLEQGNRNSAETEKKKKVVLGATTRRRASRRPPSLDEVELHERPDEEAATSGSGSSASQTAYDWWPDQLLERAVGGRAVEQVSATLSTWLQGAGATAASRTEDESAVNMVEVFTGASPPAATPAEGNTVSSSTGDGGGGGGRPAGPEEPKTAGAAAVSPAAEGELRAASGEARLVAGRKEDVAKSPSGPARLRSSAAAGEISRPPEQKEEKSGSDPAKDPPSGGAPSISSAATTKTIAPGDAKPAAAAVVPTATGKSSPETSPSSAPAEVPGNESKSSGETTSPAPTPKAAADTSTPTPIAETPRQKLKEALKQEASQAAFKPVLFNDRAAGQEAVRDSKATSEKEKVKEEKQENEAKEKEEAKEKQKVEEKQGTIGTAAADANKAEVSTPTAIAKHETGSAAGVAAETPAQQAQTTAQEEQTRAAAGDMKTTKQEDAAVKGTSTEEKKKLLAAWASGSGSVPPAQQAPQSAAAQAQPGGNEGAANRAPAGTEKVAKNLRDQQAQHAAAAPAQPLSPAPNAGGKTTTAALAGSSASGSDAAHQQIPKNSQVLVTSVSSTDESTTTAQGAGALVGKKKGPFRRLYEWIVEHLELLLLICAYLVRGFFKTSYIAFHSMIFDTTSLGNERVLVFALLDILTQICVLVSGLVSSTLLENEFTDFPALYSTMALLYCVLLVVVSNHLKETLSVSIHDFLACLDDPEPEVDLEKESLLGGGGGRTTTSQHLAGGVTGSGRPAFSTYDASQEGQLAPLTTDRAVDTSFSATTGGGNFSRSTIMFMGMAGKEQHAFKGGCGPLRRLMLGVAGVVDYFTDMFNSYLKLFFESSAFIQLWTVQCFFFTMATCMSEITSSYSIAVWSWHQGDLEFMSACMMLALCAAPLLLYGNLRKVERRSADGKRKVKLVLLDDNLVEDDVDLGRPMKSSIHDLAGHSGPWKNSGVCGNHHAPSGAAPGSFFSAPSASTGGAQLGSSATPRANNVIQISVNRRDEASLHTVVDDGSVFDGDEDGEGSERQDLENIQHNNAAKPAVFFYPESADADADVGGSRPNFGGEEKSDYVETEDEGPDHLRAGRDENGGDKMNSTVQTVGENARSCGQEETVGGAVGCGVVEQENAVCAFTAPPRLHQPSGVADTAGLRRIHTPHAGADASDGERTGTTAVKMIGDEAGRRPAAGFRRGEGEAVSGLRRVSKHDPHVDSRASDLNVVQAPSALRNEGLDDYYEQRPAAALPAPSSARSVPGGRFSHPGEHSSSLVEGLPSGRGLLRKRAVSFSSMVVTHHSEAEQEPEQWRTQERFSDAEASLHERYASLLIMGCVVNLVCELIYTAEAPYSGRFFVFMNVIRHSMAFLASIRSSFIAARLPSDKRAMCLSFFSLTSEISQAFGCYLYANLLFDPAARGFAAGLPFRFAFLMYVLADFIYIYVFYTYRDPNQALAERRNNSARDHRSSTSSTYGVSSPMKPEDGGLSDTG